MADALSDDARNPAAPEADARLPVSPSVQGIAPAWEPAERFPLSETPALEPHVVEAARGLSIENGGNSMSGTAERIGSAVGSVHRQMRRGLELVRQVPSSGAARASRMEHDILDRATTILQEVGEEVAHQASSRLDEWSVQAGERLQQIRREITIAPSRWRTRAQQFAARYPLQTIAAIAGASFVAGVMLRLNRRSHRG